MVDVIVRRLFSAIPLLLFLSIFSFTIIKSLPGDPVDVLLGSSQKDLPPEAVRQLRQELNLDKPLSQQYLGWLAGVMKGELGRSYRDGQEVTAVIGERLPPTLLLVGTALLISFSIGIALGLSMSWLRATGGKEMLEGGLLTGCLVLYSAPGFWLGFLSLAAVTSLGPLKGLPVLGLHDPGRPLTLASGFSHLILPALILSLRRLAKVALFVRASTLDELGKQYVTVARSKGMSEGAVIVRHVARNSLMPAISLLGLSLPSLLGGSVLIETVFGWPGMGRLAVDAAFGRNYPILLALILIYGALVIVSNLVADLAQVAVDPRLREGDAGSQGGLW